MGISDIIENFLQEMIESCDGELEIQRKTIAERFGCVPSQINYVIQTRFTSERGYTVESRRGGGGYLKISRISVPKSNYIMHIVNTIGDSLSFPTATVFVQNMIDYGQISVREGKIILSALTDNVLCFPLPLRDTIRASILKNMLVNLNS